jgi:hypothetical protein
MRKKAKITEKDLIELGFEKQQETAESSGSKNDWHYYTLDIEHICLISNDNEEAEEEGWAVYIFDYLDVKFTTTEDTAQLIHLLKQNRNSG